MSSLSGYDSEAVGFDSITRSKRAETSSSTQTTFEETGTASQTNFTRDCGVLATPEGLHGEEALNDYPPPGLNEFLRRVVPSMLEQLDQRDLDFLDNSSDDDEEDTVVAKLFQEIQAKQDMPGLAAGDFEASVLSVSFSSAGNSLAISLGSSQHEDWCQHSGLIRVYTVKRSEQDRLVHLMDLTEKNCVTAVKYHPSISALLAYGTATGEVVACSLKENDIQMCSQECHGAKRVAFLYWADAALANTFLTVQIHKTGKRRGASDQVLISAGSDGTMNISQVNTNTKLFETILCYTINGGNPASDITCFDFIKTCPLRPTDERVDDDIFVVGCKSGGLLLCKIKTDSLTSTIDPVCSTLSSHEFCVLDVSFSYQRPGVFASVSIDSQLRVYDVKQPAPLKVIHLPSPVTSVSWLSNPSMAILALYETSAKLVLVGANGRQVKMAGVAGDAAVHALAVCSQGSCRVATGDSDGVVRLWELPTRRLTLEPENLDF